jgi:hypothetical protein
MRRLRASLVPIAASVLLSAAPILTSCGDGPTSSGTCCKVCTTGKPCGDTCIAKNETCHKGRGCACAG